MTRSTRILILAGFCVIFAVDVVMAVLLMRPDGVRMHAPVAGTALPLRTTAAGDAWMKGGVRAVEVHIRDDATGAVQAVPGVRDAIRNRGTVVAPLAAWKAALVFPSAGAWSLSAVVTGVDGRTLKTPWRRVSAEAEARSHEFVFGSVSHVVPLAVFLALCILVPLLARRAASTIVRDRIALGITLALFVHEVVYEIYWFAIGAWTVGNCMHLHMCSLALVFLPVFYFSTGDRLPRRVLFELLYFFGLGGALQALFTPDIGMHGFPELKYFNYFFSHGTIVLGVVYAAALYRIDLTWRSWLRIAGGTVAMCLVMFGVNQLLGLFPPYEVGNYFMMGYPPPTGSVIDVFAAIFGPSPWYLAGLILMGLAVNAVITLPYTIRAIGRRRAART
jgi:hypothetical integral membrane protein (TIGR02206 family)